ncbi:TetR/AcrR family transcriptional regulator [Jonesiaceae bacterium BS-20]|uniref:TetR/AcrR family transcriptional regulator n=1 Tax=Jonesiaceae bacterium BS-20 TaxID=3120821 RepID=A0AAU7DX04_9MICO
MSGQATPKNPSTTRGSYAKGIAKREEILTTALVVIAKNGYRKASIRELATAVGLSQTGLLHYFDSKEELYAEILHKRDKLNVPGPTLDEIETPKQFIEALANLLRHNAEVPGLVQLYTQFSAEATSPEHSARSFFQARYSSYRAVVSNFVRSQQSAGALPEHLDADKIATLLAAASDGLQTQWMLDNSIDMAEHIEYLWDGLTAN